MSSSPSRAPDLAIAPPLATRVVGGFGTSILAGAAIGTAAWVADGLAWPLGLLIPANAIGAWLGGVVRSAEPTITTVGTVISARRG